MRFKPGDRVMVLCACGSCKPKTGVVRLNVGKIGLSSEDKYLVEDLSEGPHEDSYYEQEMVHCMDPVDILKEML